MTILDHKQKSLDDGFMINVKGRTLTLYLFKDFVYLFSQRGERKIFRERRREGKREGDRHPSVSSHRPPTGDPARNPGMCPDGNQTGYLLVTRPALNSLSHTSQCKALTLKSKCQETVLLFSFGTGRIFKKIQKCITQVERLVHQTLINIQISFHQRII